MWQMYQGANAVVTITAVKSFIVKPPGEKARGNSKIRYGRKSIGELLA
jgi:hypothetical protein